MKNMFLEIRSKTHREMYIRKRYQILNKWLVNKYIVFENEVGWERPKLSAIFGSDSKYELKMWLDLNGFKIVKTCCKSTGKWILMSLKDK